MPLLQIIGLIVLFPVSLIVLCWIIGLVANTISYIAEDLLGGKENTDEIQGH